MDIDRLEGLQYALEDLISAMERAQEYPEIDGIDLCDARRKLREVEAEIWRQSEADREYLIREYERSVL